MRRSSSASMHIEELEERIVPSYVTDRLPKKPSVPSISKILTGEDHLPSVAKILTGEDHLVPPPGVSAYGQYGPSNFYTFAKNNVGYDDYENIIQFNATAKGASLLHRVQGQIFYEGEQIYSFDTGNSSTLLKTKTVSIGSTPGTYTFHMTATNNYGVSSSFDGSYLIKPAFTLAPKIKIEQFKDPAGFPRAFYWEVTAQKGVNDDPYSIPSLSNDPDYTYADLYHDGQLIESASFDYGDGYFAPWYGGFQIDDGPGDYSIVIHATGSGGLSSDIPTGTLGMTGNDHVLRFHLPGAVVVPLPLFPQVTDAGNGIAYTKLGSFIVINVAANSNRFGGIITWSDPANGDHISTAKIVQQPGTNIYNVFGANSVPYVSAGTYTVKIDVNNKYGDDASLFGVILVQPPTLPSIGSLSVTPGSITDAGTDLLKLTASNVSAYNGVTNTVQYYLDSNQNGSFDANSDRLLATGGASYSGYVGGLTAGTYKLFARAYRYTFNSQLFSNVVSTTLVVTQAPPVPQVAIPSGAQTVLASNSASGGQYSGYMLPLIANDGSDNLALVYAASSPAILQWYTAAGDVSGGPVTLSNVGAKPTGFAMRADGQFVLVWTESSYVWAAVYAADGTPVTSPFKVSIAGKANGSNTSSSARVAMDAAGNFVVTWCEGDYFTEDTFRRRFTASGVARDAAPLKVNATSGASGFSSHISPDVAMDAAGNFVIVWADTTANPLGYTVQAQRYNAAGNLVGGPITVNTPTGAFSNTVVLLYDAVRVDMTPDGQFVVAWSGYGSAPSSTQGVYARRYAANGTSLDSREILVNTFPAGGQYPIRVARGPQGLFVVTWTSVGQDPGDGASGAGVYGQVFGPDGKKMGGEFRIPTTIAGNQYAGDVVFDRRGHIAATWKGNGPDGYNDDLLQRFIVNLPPTIAPLPTRQIALSGALTLVPELTDVNGDPVSVRDINGENVTVGEPVTLPSGSQVTLNADNTLTYQASSSLPAGATDSFTFTVADGNGGSATAVARFDFVTPTVSALKLTSPINAGGGLALTGVLSNPGTLDPFQVTVDWGDNVPMTYLLPATTTDFSITREATPADRTPGLHPVSVSIVDGNGAGTPATAATTTGLLSYWKGDGNTNDSTSSTPLTFVNAPAQAHAAGRIGQAFRLDGAGTYLSAGRSVLNTQESFSIDLWANPTKADNGRQVLVSEIGQENNAGQYQLRLEPTGVVTFLRRTGDSTLVDGFTTTSAIPSGQWSHITAVYSSSEARFQIYVGGVLQDGVEFTATTYSSTESALTLLGSSEMHTDYFDGLIDDAALYQRALDSSEVQALDSSGQVGTPRDATTITSFLVEDQEGNQSSGPSTGVTVQNVGPVNLNIGPDQAVWIGSLARFLGSFTDPSTTNTHTYEWNATDANGLVVATGTATNFGFTPTAAGTYQVTFKVTDNLGTSNSVSTRVNALEPLSLAASSTSFQLGFNRPMIGADQASNYVLQSVETNGLGGVDPGAVVPLTVDYSGTTATFTFDPLPAGNYLLTVKGTLTDADGNPFDGLGDGSPGSDFLQAFQVGAEPNDTLLNSTVLPADWIQGMIGDTDDLANDVDLFRITLAPGDLISFQEFNHGGLDADGNIRLRVFDASGADVTNQMGYWGTFYSATGGNFYFGVSARDNSAYDPNLAGSGQGGAWTGFYTLDYVLQNLASMSQNITSSNHTAFVAATPGSFIITTSGFPRPTLNVTGNLPSGITLTDNGDGTATLAGTPGAGTGGVYNFTVTARNGISSDATQSFAMTVNETPAITSSNSVLFVPGKGGNFTITTSGFPHASLSQTGALPASISFQDNGDGTASLTGTPPADATGTFSITITASNGIGAEAKQTFTLLVGSPPTSSVEVLQKFSKPSFTLSWSGATTISGASIASYTIYVSDNGSAFTPYLSNTSLTSATFNGTAQHQYAFYSTATDSLGNVQPKPSAAQAETQTLLNTPSKQYVAAVYVELLLRSVDLGGLNYWSDLLDKGTPRNATAASLTHSAEYFQTNVIRPAYEQFLNREADPGGLAYWTTQLQQGMTDEQMQAGYIASQEFYNSANGSTTLVPRTPAGDRKWIDALYEALLGRGPDQTGEDYWTDQLQGVQSLIQVANNFTGSKEGLSVRIQQTYRRYLGRDADPDGLAFWLSQYANGAVNEDIVTGFIASDEFFLRATS